MELRFSEDASAVFDAIDPELAVSPLSGLEAFLDIESELAAPEEEALQGGALVDGWPGLLVEEH